MTDRTRDTTKPAEESAPVTLGRRSFLRGALAGVAGLAVAAPLVACADTPTQRAAVGSGQPSAGTPPRPHSRPLARRPRSASPGVPPWRLHPEQGPAGLLLAGRRELLLRRTHAPRGREHRGRGGHDRPAHRVRRLPHRARRSLSRRLRGDRRAQRAGTRGRCPPGHRQPADLDRGLRHRAAGQPDLERPGAA